MLPTWTSGDTVVVRTIANSDGTVVDALPAIAIVDDEAVLAVYVPPGTIGKSNWVIPSPQRVHAVDSSPRSGERAHVDTVIEMGQLRLYCPGEWFSAGRLVGEGAAQGWYGNLQAPFCRTLIGIDTRDFALDVVIPPDGRWRWKDEEEFTRRAEVGLDSREHQERVRTAGLEFVRRWEEKEWPFSERWEDWRAPDDWEPRPLPSTWATDLGTDGALARAQ